MKDLLNKLKFGSKHEREIDEVKSFKEKQSIEAAFDTRDRGSQEVPVSRIVGSVGRYHDFDGQFRPKQHVGSERFEFIKKAMRNGKVFPPVKLYQIKNEYYVLDGNHRIAAAKELGWSEIRAQILEFIPSRKSFENYLFQEKAEFDDITELKHTIELTEFGHYSSLLNQIVLHRNYLEEADGSPVAMKAAAEDWYKTIYAPLTEIIKKGGLIEHFPNRSLADLYTYISVHQWEHSGHERFYGIGISRLVPKDMEEFRSKMANLDTTEYPEMVREITVFVLLNVSAKKEVRIVDKLFALDEVTEVHSVHGSVDILAKIVLKRSMLASDAETIGQFVHEKVRQIPGVISTQTLIPGSSKEKGCDLPEE